MVVRVMKESERIKQFALIHVSSDDIETVPRGVVQAICERHSVNSVDLDPESLS